MHLEKVMEKFKHMTGEQVKILFKKHCGEAIKLNVVHEPVDFAEREVVKVTAVTTPTGPLAVDLYFYKSSGTSRDDISILGTWFPLIGQKFYNGLSMIKAENDYLIALEYFMEAYRIEQLSGTSVPIIKLLNEMIDNPDILEYGRFINHLNMLIACYLTLETITGQPLNCEAL
jgi:hypothetical protein